MFLSFQFLKMSFRKLHHISGKIKSFIQLSHSHLHIHNIYLVCGGKGVIVLIKERGMNRMFLEIRGIEKLVTVRK